MPDDGDQKPFPLMTVAVLATVGLLGVYILSPVPVLYVLQHGFGVSDLNSSSTLGRVLAIVYFPLELASAGVPAVDAFYTWQMVACGLLSP